MALRNGKKSFALFKASITEKSLNMKYFYALAILVFTAAVSFGQCTIDIWSLEKRTNKSEVVIEGQVVGKQCVWDKNKLSIYTLNTIEVFKVFKGTVRLDKIILATEGGVVGLEALSVSPSLEIRKGEVGIFLLKEHTTQFEAGTDVYKPTASVQSFLKYDLNNYKALDYTVSYPTIYYDLYPEITSITNESYSVTKPFNTIRSGDGITPLAPPSITSFSLDTLTSGTGTELTINGSNFGFARGSGKVGFKDANFGDGRFYYSPTGWSYVSWSNSQIKVRVPSRAGTGVVEVVNTAGETGESKDELVIDWGHLNIVYPLSVSDTPFYELSHINDNSQGGYTWQMHSNFSSKQDAVSSFLRSLEEWRCETGMNWEVGQNTTIDSANRDNVNVVTFTSFGDSRLGVCYSRYSGCFINNRQSMQWFVNELDIEFDSTYAWYYGTDKPGFAQYDFQSVTTHELGHGHQLAHVRDNSKVMHYSLTNGQRNANLVTSDVAAGNYISNKSTANASCTQSAMIEIKPGECTITKPISGFQTNKSELCPNSSVVITDTSKGSIQNYAWDFGIEASPATAVTEGPHTVTYTTPGNQTIRLITTNNFGSDTATFIIKVKSDEIDTPSLFVTKDTACLGTETYKIDPLENAEEYLWNVASGGSIVADLINSIRVDWTEGGTHNITVLGKNDCVDGPPKSENQFVLAAPVAKFSSDKDGIEVVFTNKSEFGEEFLWSFGDGETSEELNPTHKFPDQGKYTTTLNVKNSCGENEVGEELELSYNVSISELERNYAVYPNPLSIGHTLKINGANVSTYQLHSLTGKLVESGVVLNNSITPSVSTPAMYLLTLQSDNGAIHYRLQIE